jgi:hypothetical protein
MRNKHAKRKRVPKDCIGKAYARLNMDFFITLKLFLVNQKPDLPTDCI